MNYATNFSRPVRTAPLPPVAPNSTIEFSTGHPHRRRTNRRRRQSGVCVAVAMAALLPQVSANAAGKSEFLLFLSGDYLERSSVEQDLVQTSDFTPAADALFSYANGSWRIVGEYFLTDDENELERLQFGYDFANDSTAWFGRFHQPISAWNYRYHHGAYVQPSISRPAIENWEDEGGVLPAHVAGFLLETWQPLGEQSGLRYAVSAGIAPVLEDFQLEPFDLLDPASGGQKPAGSVNISYFPDYVGASNVGLIAGYAEIESKPIPTLGIDSDFVITQTLIGAQVVWEGNQWQLISAAYYVDNDPRGTAANVGGWFIAGYAQAQRSLSKNTSAYFRIERTGNAGGSGYLHLFPGYVHQRDVIGLRYDFAERQAFTAEISSDKVFGDEYEEFRVQWSAAFP